MHFKVSRNHFLTLIVLSKNIVTFAMDFWILLGIERSENLESINISILAKQVNSGSLRKLNEYTGAIVRLSCFNVQLQNTYIKYLGFGKGTINVGYLLFHFYAYIGGTKSFRFIHSFIK